MYAFDHAAGGHDDRAVALALMLIEAIERGDAGTPEEIVYAQDRFAPEPVIARGDLRLVGSRYLDAIGVTDGWGEPIRQAPPGWASAPDNPMLRGAGAD